MTPRDPSGGLVGQVLLDKFRVERVLGKGGMGAVLLARHIQLDQPVALKVLLPRLLDSPESIERFLREARVTAKITSRHVARVLDVAMLPEGAPCLVLEYLDGTDLQHVVRDKGALPVVDAVDHLLEACDAVAEAHAQGIVHRDIKPANLFLAKTADGQPVVKVLDFGIAKTRFDPRLPPLTRTQMTIGSAPFMSPEQIRDAKSVDPRADVYSLGCVLYSLLTGGHTPFEGGDAPNLFARVLSGKPTPITEHRSGLDPALVTVVEKATVLDASLRYQSVVELVRALSPWASERARPAIERVQRIAGQGGTPKSRSGPRGTGVMPEAPAHPSHVSPSAQARAPSQPPSGPSVSGGAPSSGPKVGGKGTEMMPETLARLASEAAGRGPRAPMTDGDALTRPREVVGAGAPPMPPMSTRPVDDPWLGRAPVPGGPPPPLDAPLDAPGGPASRGVPASSGSPASRGAPASSGPPGSRASSSSTKRAPVAAYALSVLALLVAIAAIAGVSWLYVRDLDRATAHGAPSQRPASQGSTEQTPSAPTAQQAPSSAPSPSAAGSAAPASSPSTPPSTSPSAAPLVGAPTVGAPTVGLPTVSGPVGTQRPPATSRPAPTPAPTAVPSAAPTPAPTLPPKPKDPFDMP